MTRILKGNILSFCRHYNGPKFHGVLCDPPYELGFMGKHWDRSGVAFQPDTWAAIGSLLLPGAHLMAFGGSRTFHRMAVAIEDAGFEIRDTLMYLYGSGFPKSLDVSKAIDKAAGAERENIAPLVAPAGNKCKTVALGGSWQENPMQTAPATADAITWQGYGTALKPAFEPVIMARWPLEGTVAANCQKHGAGALNVDGCRVGTGAKKWETPRGGIWTTDSEKIARLIDNPLGRWPANIIHDGSQMVMDLFPQSKSTGGQASLGAFRNGDVYGKGKDIREKRNPGFGDSGSAARFFYCAKASKKERGEGNNHPTVKPIALTEYLARLILPATNGRLMVPFAGSGSEMIGAYKAGWNEIIGIELMEEYVNIAKARIQYHTKDN